MSKNPNSYKTSIYIGIGVFVVIFSLCVLVSNLLVNLRNERKMQEEINVLNSANLRLQENLYRSLAISRTLGFYVQKFGFPNNLDSIGKDFIGTDRTIRAIELLKQGEIVMVYPINSNEKAIGYDILKDSARNIEANYAKNTKTFYFAGPLELRQGGIGIVGRMPIFIGEQFIGFSAVVLDFNELLKVSGINPSFNPDFIFQLTKNNPNTHIEEKFINNAPDVNYFERKTNVKLPMGNWNLFISRKRNNQATYWTVLLSVGFVLSVVSAFLAYVLSKQPAYLKKKIEEKISILNRNENLLDVTQTTAKVGSWEINYTNNGFYCTELTKSIYGLTPKDEMSYNDFLNFVDSNKDRQLLEDAVVKCAQEHGDINLELKIRRKDGELIWVNITGRLNPNFKDILIFGATQDIDELIESQAEKIEILESIDDAFIACNKSLEVVYVNRSFAKLIQRKESDMLVLHLSDILDKEVIDKIHDQSARSSSDNVFFEYYSNQWQLWFEVSIFNREHGFSIYLKDVTEKNKYLKELLQQNEKLRQIAWMQSHVVRAPLVKIIGSVDMLKPDNSMELNQKLLQIIRDSSHQLDSIINEISETARKEGIEN